MNRQPTNRPDWFRQVFVERDDEPRVEVALSPIGTEHPVSLWVEPSERGHTRVTARRRQWGTALARQAWSCLGRSR